MKSYIDFDSHPDINIIEHNCVESAERTTIKERGITSLLSVFSPPSKQFQTQDFPRVMSGNGMSRTPPSNNPQNCLFTDQQRDL